MIWISLLSYPPFSALLLYPLEHSYSKVQFGQNVPKYIHVLGHSHIGNPAIPLSSELSLVGLARVTEGVSIYKRYPEMKIIFSGYGGDEPVSDARKNGEMALSMGVKATDILFLESAKDTYQEALQAKKIVGNQPLVLVTSASHMPRAVALFKKAGIKVIAAPTDFHVKKKDTLLQFPSAEGLLRSETAFHEYFGIAWSQLTGLI
ncbi:MAG: YdcF family protein [Sulfuricurvum sp.]|uniref:YdcF family protein n=1 Tax=Sulfuricurvum sp. TaxID=2025608 RepID=UPI0025DA91F3|nr:ElyC/SanA/YdcF family protein [Sulfuricurvum sp.]MCK9371730.1 YdcF family protein [Sulfuricurvum sp.]